MIAQLVEAIFALGPSVEAVKAGTDHEGHDGWQMGPQLPGRVQCSCGQPLDDILGMPPLVTWHMAHCVECTMPRMPFADVGQRDAWAEVHANSTGHTVTRYEEKR